MRILKRRTKGIITPRLESIYSFLRLDEVIFSFSTLSLFVLALMNLFIVSENVRWDFNHVDFLVVFKWNWRVFAFEGAEILKLWSQSRFNKSLYIKLNGKII